MTYDVAVLACHADQALAMIDRPTAAECNILGAFDYQENRTILHPGPRLMPQRQAAWASWNDLAYDTELSDVKVSVTCLLNHLQSLSAEHLALVSLNPINEPDPATVVAEYSYAHPLFDQKAMDAQARLHEIQGCDRLWFAGARWGSGFHEDELHSGLRVVADLGVTPPWWTHVEPLMPPPLDLPLAEAASGGD